MKRSFVAQSVALVLASSASFAVLADDSALVNDSADDDSVIVVTANRMKQDINDTLADVEIIDRAEIERIQPQSFVDLLVNVAGIDFVQRGGHGQETSIFSRGTNSNQTLILIDGVRVASATLGVKSVSNISISQIERVEIVKGPRAALWGSDAIGGVIQIFTRRFSPGEHKVSATIGSNGAREIDVSVGVGSGDFVNTITYGRRETDGFDARIDNEPDDDGFEYDSLAIRGDYQLSDYNTVDWVVQADEGKNDFDTTWGGNVSHFNNYLWNLRFNHENNGWNNQLAVSGVRDQSFSTGNGVTRESAGVFETRRLQYSILTRKSVTDELSIGGGIDRYEDSIEKSTATYANENRQTKSFHVSANYVGETFLADFAVRKDDVEQVANEKTFNFSFGYRLDDDNLLSLNYGEGFKAPTFNDLFYPQGGNPNLKFETSDNLELLYKGVFTDSSLTVSVYDSEIENLIQWVRGSNGIWSPQNVGEAEISGVDVSYSLTQGDYQHEITASRVSAEDANSGDPLIRRAKNHFGYQISFASDKFDWFSQLEYVGKRPEVGDIELDSYTRVNVGVGYQFDNHWQLKFKVNDLFDEAPTTVAGYNPIEREFYLTVSHQNLF
ncbi:TonB-dependent receptor domain-containing protein [Aliikangiella coralliicola]|uniref:TonB-dependent receptor n=1 Tax=Aliikangiella coralliicola TaxID=2592383 RepID=A0A545UJI2_9GAMM|nr:TonB-dependent receptor [Aliikangiella coralliicola]TQV89624.1 TonB-dependent receptor [Aliikangiella coralliicola]